MRVPLITTPALPPLPLGAPPRAVAALSGLRAETRTLGMAVPDAPAALRHPAPVRLRPEALAWHALAELGVVVAVYDHVADEIESALSELAALAPLTGAVS